MILEFDLLINQGADSICDNPPAPIDAATILSIIVEDDRGLVGTFPMAAGDVITYPGRVEWRMNPGDLPVGANEVIHYYTAYVRYENPESPVVFPFFDTVLFSSKFQIAVIKKPTLSL